MGGRDDVTSEVSSVINFNLFSLSDDLDGVVGSVDFLLCRFFLGGVICSFSVSSPSTRILALFRAMFSSRRSSYGESSVSY